jgi:hypothetical protein
MDYQELYDAVTGNISEWTRQLVAGRLDIGQYRQNMSVGHIGTMIAARQQTTTQVQRPELRPAFGGAPFLNDDDRTVIRSILWQFVGQGLLAPTGLTDELNTRFETTPYGREVFQNEEAAGPYDPTGYLAVLRRDAPQLEPETFDLIEEALSCYRARFLRSCAVMTGVASELEILKVIELVSERLAAEEKTDFDRAIQGANSIARKSRVLFEKLEQQRRDLPQDIRELDLWLNAIFNII